VSTALIVWNRKEQRLVRSKNTRETALTATKGFAETLHRQEGIPARVGTLTIPITASRLCGMAKSTESVDS
jgi:hypothetical protein